ncbi:hypothetical protein N9N67_08220 [Bacteriovoracaceae bacterium]|nr:hypothetical protein [Bacteriovoracaceae bacterium]
MIIQTFILLIYQFFMFGQWYLLGKEVDNRLKIYYRVNSTMDRFLYRIIVGNLLSTSLFALIAYLGNEDLINIFYWSFFVIVGLFYSWPTRGKIVEESVSSQFKEFRFLDSFEKNILILTITFFIFSLPELPLFSNVEALKLYLDPQELLSGQLWNFLKVLYSPFSSYSSFYTLAICLHIYVVGLSFFLISLYCFLRYFISRRLAILGLFAFISTWSFTKIIHVNFLSIYSSTFILIWLWSMLWVRYSSTYRSGFFLGLISYFAVLLNANNIVLFFLSLLLTYFLFSEDRTRWYKNQLIKYTFFGLVLSLTVLVQHYNFSFTHHYSRLGFIDELAKYANEKSFYRIAYLGLFLLPMSYLKKFKKMFFRVTFNKEMLWIMLCFLFFSFVCDVYFGLNLYTRFGVVWILVFLSLLPLEWIFQSITRLRNRRNMIYVFYALVLLLDSHFDQRVRIVIKSIVENDYSTIF